ncbi:MIZ/SP-RING zinc finger domain-containing protein [Ditylenchus destructor]|uniref:MIZ/SP-RING zinc finger domain-containing protein n=1 Tax=Ditylenchus destructor TaxID=166010 RepID=A0AAD4QQZ5_9BILA|nr:MIZ/SP-RING zinc finger domain-containing protein [Ditylenchus destructor]
MRQYSLRKREGKRIQRWETEYDRIVNDAGNVLSMEEVRRQIAQALEHSEIEQTKVSLLCPLTKERIEVPVRYRDCRHLQCFDLKAFLAMKAKRNFLNCPICDAKIDRELTITSLCIDKFFQQILSDVSGSTEAVILSDGTYQAAASQSALIIPKVIDDEEPFTPDQSATFTCHVKSEIDSDDDDIEILDSNSSFDIDNEANNSSAETQDFHIPDISMADDTNQTVDHSTTHSDETTTEVATLKNDYESRIRELNQEIQNVKSSEQQKLSFLATKYTMLKDALAGKISEMKALENRLESKNLTLDQEKKELEAKCTKLKCKLLKKDSEVEALSDRLQSQSSALGQEKKHLKKQCTKLNAELVKKNAEFETLKQSKALALQDGESRINKLNQEIRLLKSSEQQKIFDFEVKCAKLNDELLKKGSELETLNDMLHSQSSALGQEKKDLEAQCAKLNDELLKKDSELEALKQSKTVALQDGELRIRELNQEILLLKSSEQQKLLFLEAQCSELRSELLEKKSELEVLSDYFAWSRKERIGSKMRETKR